MRGWGGQMNGNATIIYVPRDTTSLAMGADEVAAVIQSRSSKDGVDITIIRNGSRGLFWLEPMVEVETKNGRMAYGHVAPGGRPTDSVSQLLGCTLEAGNSPLLPGPCIRLQGLRWR